MDDQYAVEVRNACKIYPPDFKVLNNFNMKVSSGTIYGLLGPSGCGKTTLLSCIVGRLQLNSGEIILKNKKISDIGYMPQELALHMILTIKETFTFYGYIFNLSDDEIAKRAQQLKGLLQLPSYSLCLNEISGGQQRRVSIGIAMLHDPKLLILDEPTVGLDPLISQSVWQLLMDITSKEGKTVIITTHYIEEAKQSQMIGLMRKGTLLSESTPTELLTLYDCTYLEEAFLKVCQSHVTKTNGFEIPVKQHTQKLPNARITTLPTESNNNLFAFCRFKAQTYKNIYLLRRNIPLTLFLIFLPLIESILFNITCGNDPQNLSLGVFNEEIIGNSSEACSISEIKGCFLDGGIPISCLLMERLNEKNYKLVEYSSLEDGQYAMLKNKVWAFFHISQNYSDNLLLRINEGSDISDNTTFELGTINTWLDKSNKIIYDQIKKDMYDSYKDVIDNLTIKCNLSEKVFDSPVDMLDPIYGKKTPSFVNYANPAIMALCAFFFPLSFTASSIVFEKEGGVINRVLLTGMNFLEIALAQVAVQLIIIITQTTLIMIVTFIAFDNPFVGDIFPPFLLMVLIGICGMIFGFLISVICRKLTETSYMSLGSNFMMQFLCGLIWPIEGIHRVLRKISTILPVTIMSESLRALTSKGLGLRHPTVYMGFVMILCWIAFISFVIYIILKLKRDSWSKS